MFLAGDLFPGGRAFLDGRSFSAGSLFLDGRSFSAGSLLLDGRSFSADSLFLGEFLRRLLRSLFLRNLLPGKIFLQRLFPRHPSLTDLPGNSLLTRGCHLLPLFACGLLRSHLELLPDREKGGIIHCLWPHGSNLSGFFAGRVSAHGSVNRATAKLRSEPVFLAAEDPQISLKCGLLDHMSFAGVNRFIG